MNNDNTTPTHSEETETTPTPWEQSGNGIFPLNGTSCIATTHNINGDEHQREANTKYIVTAVNSHSSLVRRVEEQKKRIEELEAVLKECRMEFTVMSSSAYCQISADDDLIYRVDTALTKP